VKYVLLFVETEQYAKDLDAMEPADRDRAFMLVGQWFMDNADKVKGGSKLRAPDTATTVRRGDDGDHVVIDGPFVEGKEVVSGYAEVEADNLDQVLAMVKTWPGCPVVEIRPLEP
jgi:hypothetical protein